MIYCLRFSIFSSGVSWLSILILGVPPLEALNSSSRLAMISLTMSFSAWIYALDSSNSLVLWANISAILSLGITVNSSSYPSSDSWSILIYGAVLLKIWNSCVLIVSMPMALLAPFALDLPASLIKFRVWLVIIRNSTSFPVKSLRVCKANFKLFLNPSVNGSFYNYYIFSFISLI